MAVFPSIFQNSFHTDQEFQRITDLRGLWKGSSTKQVQEKPQVSGPIKAISCRTVVRHQAFGHAAHAEWLTKLHTNTSSPTSAAAVSCPTGGFGQI